VAIRRQRRGAAPIGGKSGEDCQGEGRPPLEARRSGII